MQHQQIYNIGGDPHQHRWRYRVPSQSWFRAAPITKALSAIILSGSTWLFIFDALPQLIGQHQLQVVTFVSIPRWLYHWTLYRMFFADPVSIISGMVLLYHLRWVERRFGSMKYLNFLLTTSLISSVLEFALIDTDRAVIVGPYSLIASIFVQFHLCIPNVPYARLLSIPLSLKLLPSIMFAQFLFRSRNTLIACICGCLSTVIYRHNVFYCQRWNFIPNIIANICTNSIANPIGWMLNRFVYLADDDSDSRVLPMAATLERQRVELLDEYERRLMLRQMQNSYLRQQPANVDNRLRFVDRLFADNRPTQQQNVDEAVVQQLIDMGFNDRDAIRWALVQCHNDVSQATNFLLQQRS